MGGRLPEASQEGAPTVLGDVLKDTPSVLTARWPSKVEGVRLLSVS